MDVHDCMTHLEQLHGFVELDQTGLDEVGRVLEELAHIAPTLTLQVGVDELESNPALVEDDLDILEDLDSIRLGIIGFIVASEEPVVLEVLRLELFVFVLLAHEGVVYKLGSKACQEEEDIKREAQKQSLSLSTHCPCVSRRSWWPSRSCPWLLSNCPCQSWLMSLDLVCNNVVP